MQRHPAGDRMSSSPIEMAQDDESVPPAVPVAASRRRVGDRWRCLRGGGGLDRCDGWAFARTDAPIASGPASAVATTPVEEPPTVNPADASAEEAALGFLDAYAAFDAQKAMTYVTDNADLTGVIDATGSGEHRGAVADALHAQGCRATNRRSPRVRRPPSGPTRASSAITTSTPLGSDQIGRGPFSGSYFVFTVRDGAIVRASVSENLEKFDRQMWEPFAEWVSSTYPKDAAVMYLDGTLAPPRLSPESIRLWERHTREYVETPRAETAQDVVRYGTCSGDSRSRLVLKDLGDKIRVRFFIVFPNDHPWRIVLWHGRAGSEPFNYGDGRVFTWAPG